MDFEKIVNSNIYTFFDKLFVLVLINMLWFFISFLGLGIFTIYPATFSVFLLINLYIKDKSFPIIKLFFKAFIKFYWKAQKVFLVFLLFGFVLFFNVRVYYYQIIDEFSYLTFFGLIVTLIIILFYVFALIQSFYILFYFPNFKTFKTIKYSFLFGIAFIFQSLLVLVITLIPILLIIFYPILFPFIFVILTSLLIYISIKIIKHKYDKIMPNQKVINLLDFI